ADGNAPTIETPGRLVRPLLASAVALLMVLLALSPIRGHEFWLHLGIGKALSEGRYQFGSDPLLQGSTDYWANPSWLTPLVAFEVYQWLGGPGFVLLKAAALAATALVLLILCGFRKNPWLASAVALVAVLALGMWQAPEPSLMSLLFLAVFL